MKVNLVIVNANLFCNIVRQVPIGRGNHAFPSILDAVLNLVDEVGIERPQAAVSHVHADVGTVWWVAVSGILPCASRMDALLPGWVWSRVHPADRVVGQQRPHRYDRPVLVTL